MCSSKNRETDLSSGADGTTQSTVSLSSLGGETTTSTCIIWGAHQVVVFAMHRAHLPRPHNVQTLSRCMCIVLGNDDCPKWQFAQFSIGKAMHVVVTSYRNSARYYV